MYTIIITITIRTQYRYGAQLQLLLYTGMLYCIIVTTSPNNIPNKQDTNINKGYVISYYYYIHIINKNQISNAKLLHKYYSKYQINKQ